MTHELKQPCNYHVWSAGKTRGECDACLREYEAKIKNDSFWKEEAKYLEEMVAERMDPITGEI